MKVNSFYLILKKLELNIFLEELKVVLKWLARRFLFQDCFMWKVQNMQEFF